jgi:hypothetical protein
MLNSEYHREHDLPAIISKDPETWLKQWLYYGRFHRVTRDENDRLMPATLLDSSGGYYINGVRCDENGRPCNL